MTTDSFLRSLDHREGRRDALPGGRRRPFSHGAPTLFARGLLLAALAGPVGSAALYAPAALAQVTGKVVGTVTDRATGAPLVGAQISVPDVRLGNVTNEDGSYFINNVPVGVQRFEARYLGYRSAVRADRVFAGHTMTVDFALEPEAVETPPLVAVVELEPLIVRDQTVSKTRFTGARARALPVDAVREVVTLGAGIYVHEGDFIIRGGRATETSTYVDGVLVSDFDIQRTRTDVGLFAAEEVDVITGGFDAQFGHAQSGIINIVTREGGSDFHGALRFLTDGRFGTDGYDAEEREAFAREECCGFNQLHASLGGPVLLRRLTFFGSAELTGAADIDPRSGGFNPAMGGLNSSGSRRTILPGNRGDRTRLQTKLTAFPAPSTKVSTTYLYSRDQLEGFMPTRSVDQFSSGATRTKAQDVIVNYDQTLLHSAERSVGLQLRGHYHRASTVSGTPMSREIAAFLEEALGDGCGRECDLDGVTTFDDGVMNYRPGDIRFMFEDSLLATVFEVPFFRPERAGLDLVFGVPDVWRILVSDHFDRQWERRYALRADLDAQLSRAYRVKAGGEWTWINLTSQEGGLLTQALAELYDVDPRVAAAYVQNRLDYGDLVIDLGIRWDHWNPNALVPVIPGEVNCAITQLPPIGCTDEDPFVEARTRNAIAPRLGVAHPVTDRTQVRASFGRFHQLPELQHFFQHFTSDHNFGFNTSFGNPNLDFVETTALEVGVTHVLAKDWVLDVVGFNRDRRGAIRQDIFQPGVLAPRQRFEILTFVNADHGNVKGVDITLSKRYSSYFSTDLAWSLQWARGTTSDPTEFAQGFGLLFDPLFPGRRLTPPNELSPESFDRTHVLNWQFNVRFPNDLRKGTALGRGLGGLGAYLVYNMRSGTPYTRTNEDGFPLGDFGDSRLPWAHVVDLRLSKGVELGSPLALDLFLDFRNLFDWEIVNAVSPRTGRPDRCGSEIEESRTPFIRRAFLEPEAPPSFPLPLELVQPRFRETLGRQDLNGDGLIAFEEAQVSLRRALIAVCDSAFRYGEPRQIRFGAEIRF